ncbi:MAG: hypothetical protein Q4E81_08555 [Succinatimonas sp.]|nr:hypothetical protein [Succinatimonas sp.]
MAKLNQREIKLLADLDELMQLSEQLSQKLIFAQNAQQKSEADLQQLRQEVVSLREENQHLREVMQTWRQRLEMTLKSLSTPE